MPHQSKTNKLYTFFGWFLLIYGLINILVEIFAFKPPPEIRTSFPLFQKTQLQVINSIFFSLLAFGGLIIIRGKRTALFNMGLSLTTIFLFCGFAELVLRLPYFQDPEKNKAIWIPPRLKALDLEINKPNYERASQHPDGFNDEVRTISKPAGRKRIAILGDSFVWGEGLPYGQSWNHLLEKKIAETYPRFEVLSWGKRGWNTLNQFHFLEKKGINYDIDYLIVGFVENDPDWAKITQKHFIWQGTWFLRPAHFLFPNLLDFVASGINNILEKNFFNDYGYNAWLEKLYSEKNLVGYRSLLKEVSEFSRDNKIPLLFVLTPQNVGEEVKKHFERIIPLLEGASISYLNLFPDAYDRFHALPERQLWANPANSHPGKELNELFADKVFEHLRSTGVLEDRVNNAKD